MRDYHDGAVLVEDEAIVAIGGDLVQGFGCGSLQIQVARAQIRYQRFDTAASTQLSRIAGPATALAYRFSHS